MMKQEFESMIGYTIPQENYNRIEFVYMNDEQFQTKQNIVDFYNQYDMNGIETKYHELKGHTKTEVVTMAEYEIERSDGKQYGNAIARKGFFQIGQIVDCGYYFFTIVGISKEWEEKLIQIA